MRVHSDQFVFFEENLIRKIQIRILNFKQVLKYHRKKSPRKFGKFISQE